MTQWVVESFTPSDRSKVCGVEVDHQAWLFKSGDRKIYIGLNISTRDVSADEALALVNAMVAGLNAAT